MLYNFYVYNRRGKCLYYKEWNRPLNTLSDDPDEERKLMYGMLFSLKDLSSKLSPGQSQEGLHTVKTNAFTLHHFESLTGMVFILNTDPGIADMYNVLKHIYSHIFIESVTKNPLYEFRSEEPINCPLFTTRLEEYLASQTQSS